MTSGSSSHGNSAEPHGSSGSGLLTERIAGQAVIEKLLADRRDMPPKSLLERIFGSNPLTPENYSWYKGALGEIRVGQVLSVLGPQWRVLHAVPVGTGTSDIDHVLIGPAGVFTVNTKNHAGQAVWVGNRTFMVAGQRQRHLYNATYEAERAGKLLSRATGKQVRVAAVVVVIAPKTMTVREKPAGVAVLADRELLPWLTSRPAVLTAWEVNELAAAAVQPGTWHRRPIPTSDSAALWREFTALESHVNSARRRRAGWVLTLFLGAPLVLVTLFNLL